MALELGFFKKDLEFFGILFVVAVREKKTQVFDVFVTFTVLIMRMLCTHRWLHENSVVSFILNVGLLYHIIDDSPTVWSARATIFSQYGYTNGFD